MNRVRVESDGAVARVTLARPEKKNALDRETAAELLQAFTSAAQHTGTRVVLLAADGPDFCAGADLTALAAMIDAPAS
ncbi:MAG: enoyl-CoA hydratase/isomerase family protein, partial [Gemmatimonadaceae bacterium]